MYKDAGNCWWVPDTPATYRCDKRDRDWIVFLTMPNWVRGHKLTYLFILILFFMKRLQIFGYIYVCVCICAHTWGVPDHSVLLFLCFYVCSTGIF